MATTFKKVSNNGRTSLAADITTTGQTSIQINLGDTSKFPASGSFKVRIYNNSNPDSATTSEQVLVTGVIGNTWTVTRNYDSLGSTTFSAGHAVRLNVEAGEITDLQTAVNTVENKLDGTSSGVVLNSPTITSPTISTPPVNVARITGEITMWSTASAPTGWLICDGSAVSRTTYSSLFSVLGTTYGSGNGTTTFNLPNLKGKVPVGLDSAQTEFDALGETGGAKTHTLTTSEMPSHTHTQDPHNHGAGAAGQFAYSNAVGQVGNGTAFAAINNFSNSTANATATNQNTGGGGAHNNLQPYITLNFIIKT